MNKSRILMGLALAAGFFASTATAGTLTNGTLSVSISNANGAITSAALSGNEYYNLGSPVADWGMQTGTNTGTFARNTMTGTEQIIGTNVSGSGTETFTGSYTAGGASVGVVRVNSLVSGFNILQTTSTLTNNGSSAITIRLFDTFDPDQGVPGGTGFATFNNVAGGDSLGTVAGTAEAIADAPGGGTTPTGFSVVYAVVPAATGFGTSFGLEINSGSELNGLFSSPVDPNGAFSDIGIGLGYEVTLAAGASASFTLYQAFGPTPENARDQILGITAIPEPGTLALLGAGAASLAGYGLRRRKVAR